MIKKLRCAVVGAGYWGINYVRLLSQLSSATLVAVCEKSEKRAQDIKLIFPEVKIINEFEDLFHVDFDAAIVCTDPSSHYQVAKKLLENKKHVLVEKPITTKSDDAQDLINLAEINQVILMVGHIFLFNSGIQKIKEEIASGNTGKVHYLYSKRTNLGPIRNDVNAIWDLAPHDIVIFNYLLDSLPEWVSAVGASFLRPGIPDVGFIQLGYPGGIIGSIHVSWIDPNKVREVVVVGSEQRILFNDISPQQKVTIYKKGIAASTRPLVGYGAFQTAIRDGDIYMPSVEISEPLSSQVQNFLDCIREKKQPLTDGRNGMEVIKVLEAIDESVSKNGMPIALKK